MTNGERRRSGFQWAEPIDINGFEVSLQGEALSIRGKFPSYKESASPADLLSQYRLARKNSSKKRTGRDSPHVRFANAETDQELISFLRSFGPMVASSVRITGDPQLYLEAIADLGGLRRERTIYHSALSLVVELNSEHFDFGFAKDLIAKIADGIREWPQQWSRERQQRKTEPFWNLKPTALQRITAVAALGRDPLLRPEVDARIVVCELLNVFPGTLFPNPLEMHSEIRFGIRPLLYAILRHEVLYPHETQVCANVHCRDFFELERHGQTFCSSDCSRHQRQREYWKKKGKKLRKKRLKLRRK